MPAKAGVDTGFPPANTGISGQSPAAKARENPEMAGNAGVVAQTKTAASCEAAARSIEPHAARAAC
jgi:hypothetical protein